jgi:putative mRNA 3-end processing factor
MVTRRDRKVLGADPGLVEWDGGLRLSGSPLWLDATRPVPLSFISSALTFRRHQRIITSSQTITLLEGQLGSSEALPTPWGRTFSVGDLVIDLLPAGGVVGSALLRVRRGGLTLVYAKGLRLGASQVVATCQLPEADVVVLDCPYDAPPYSFVTPQRLVPELLAWVRLVLDEGGSPVLLAGALGMAQEACHLLSQEGLATKVHRQVALWNRRVRACGVALAPLAELRRPIKAGEVVVAPPEAAGSASLRRLVPGARLALVSGAASVTDRVANIGAEIGFAWSGGADGADLRRFIKKTGAGYVYLGPHHSDRFEASLRRLGVGVTRFDQGPDLSQLELFA